MKLALLAMVSGLQLWGAQRYPVSGIILKIDRPHRSLVVSCRAIPGYMDAMVMPFLVPNVKALDGIVVSDSIDFTLVVGQSGSHAEGIHKQLYQSVQREPLEAGRLTMIENLGTARGTTVALGQMVPDFALMDQTGRPFGLAQVKGKVVVASFVYTRCPLPDYCFRLSNNLGRVQKRFADRMGKDLELLSITIDPAHDTPAVLAQYATIWKANPAGWRFLTGTPEDVSALARRFGVDYWPGEGSLTHSLHTIVIDRRGRLAANFEGNEFTSDQLGDFVASELAAGRPSGEGAGR